MFKSIPARIHAAYLGLVIRPLQKFKEPVSLHTIRRPVLAVAYLLSMSLAHSLYVAA